jgi:hypothetical protein
MEHGGEQDVRVLLDTGSEITFADNSLKSCASELLNIQKSYGGVSSSGISEQSGHLSIQFGNQLVQVEAAFTDLPSNMDMIIGLDSKLAKFDLDKQKAVIDGKTIRFDGLSDPSQDISLHQVFEIQSEIELVDEEKKDSKVPEELQSILDKHKKVFAVENWSTISSLDAVEVQLSENAVPVRCPPIKQSEEDEHMIEGEVQDMLKKGYSFES